VPSGANSGGQFTFTLSVEGVPGDFLPIRSFRWAAQAAPETGEPSAADDVLVERVVDHHSPIYLKRLAKQGSPPLGKATIKGNAQSGKQDFTIKLTHVFISSYEVIGLTGTATTERFSLSFEKMHFHVGTGDGDYEVGE
jgi:type VI protein secretion system component Hcp